jgi:cell division septation protein DedD
MLEDINRLQAEIARQKADNNKLRAGTLEQSAKITADTQRIKDLEAELAQTKEQLEEMKEVDLRMHTKRVNGSNGSPVKLVRKAPKTHLGADFLKTSAATYPEPTKSEDFNTPIPTSSEDTPSQTQEAYPYTVQISSYSIKKDAVHAAKEARKKGNTGFSSHARIADKGDWYRVYIGFYRTFDEAKKAALELKNRNNPNAFAAKMPFAIRIEVPVSEKDLEKIERDLEDKGYLTYTVRGGEPHDKNTRLIGAFATEKAALNHIKILQDAGFNPRVVRR